VAVDVELVPVELTVPVLQAFELYRFYHTGDDEVMALRGVNLTLAQGDFVAISGPSGSGKSTLLACLAGLDEPDGGHVEILGQRLTRRSEGRRAHLRARHIGMLMQGGNLFNHLTVRGNIQLRMHLAGKVPHQNVNGLLKDLGLEARGNAYPEWLSGGETARAGLAVALAVEPDVLLCDEPTAEVDARTEKRVLDRLQEACRAGGTVLIATHSAAVAERANRVIVLRDGRITHDSDLVRSA
jgi:putative ABC transport system ATP-binding protein